MEEKKSLFRANSIERIASPEQLNDYIRVVNPGIWIILGAVVFLLVGFVFWGCFAELETKVPCIVSDSGICYVSEADFSARALVPGMKIRDGGSTYTISEIENEAVPSEDTLSEYELHLGEFESGEWVHAIHPDCTPEPGARVAYIVVAVVNPISFIVNG